VKGGEGKERRSDGDTDEIAITTATAAHSILLSN
jgi:hypothetical protein